MRTTYGRDDNPPKEVWSLDGKHFLHIGTSHTAGRQYEQVIDGKTQGPSYTLEALLDIFGEMTAEPPLEPCVLKQIIVHDEVEAKRTISKLPAWHKAVVYLSDGTLGRVAGDDTVALNPSGHVYALNQVEYPLVFVYPLLNEVDE